MNLGADVLNLPEGLVVTIESPPAKNAASIEVARQFARIDTGLDDKFVQTLMQSATEKIETFINRKLITQTVVAHWECGASRIVLPFGNVQGVTSVEIGQEDGTFVNTTFVLRANTIYLDESESAANSNVKVTYITGYGDSDADVHGVIKEHIYKLILTSYDNRENVIVGESVMTMPNSFKKELAQFINYESF